MAKKPTITSITSGYASTNTLNDNFEALRDAFDNTLSLDGSTPNSMTSDLNLNNNDILNASRILVGGVDYIATALSYKNAAEAAQTAAETAQAAAELAYDNFDDRYLGSKASDPTLDNDGNALLDGALYYDTINTVMKFYDTSTSTWYRTTPTTSDQANIDIVAGNTTNINTVAGISANVTTVAGISSDVTTVAADGTDIGTVATSISNVNTAATNISNINTVAGISANVTTVAGNTSNINTVATDISNVNTVASQTTNLQNVTDNLTAIQNAATNATNAATSASNAATSASNASTSETNAASSATSAAASAAAAAASADFFDDVYLGSKASDPSTDNDGDALNAGDLYFNTTSNNLKVYSGSAWQDAAVDSSGFVQTTGDTLTGNLNFNDNVKAQFGDGNDLQIYHDGSNSYIDDAGTGNLTIRANQINFDKYTGEALARFRADGNTELFYDNASKLTTTSTGVDITGTLTSDGLTVESSDPVVLQHSATGPTLRFNNIDQTVADGQQLARLEFSTDDAGIEKDEAYIQLTADGNAGAAFLDIMTGDGAPTKTARFSTNGDISFYEDTGSTPKMVWKAADERLGIGTTSPDNSLHVSYANSTAYSDATGDFGIQIENTDTTTNAFSQLHFRTGNSDSYIRNIREGDNLASLAFLTDDGGATGDVGEAMRISSGGVVSIANSAPKTWSSNSQAVLQIGNTGALELYDTTDDPFSLLSNLYRGTDNSYKYIENNEAARISFYQGDINFTTAPVGTADTNATITSRLFIQNEGNVGIGVTNPEDFTGGANNLVVGTGSGDQGISIYAGSSSDSSVFFVDSSSGTGAYRGQIRYRHDVDDMSFHTAGGFERMRIDSSGNLIVGATSAVGDIHGQRSDGAMLWLGRTTSSGQTTALLGEIRFGDTVFDSNLAAIQSNLDGSTTSSNLSFYTQATGAASAERMRIDSSGNVGIGTTSTGGAKLGVVGSSAANGYMYVGHSTVNLLLGAGGALSSDSTLPYVRSNTSLGFATGGGNERMRIDSSGNVGIGTSSPLQALHVNSGTGNSAAIFESTDATSQIWLKDSASSSTYQTGIACYGDNLLLNNGGERMRIDSSGNLLVGKSSSDFGETSGLELLASGPRLYMIRDGGTPMEVGRLTSDGEIINFTKDGTTVGSIGAVSGDAYIATGDVGLRFDDGNNILRPVNNSGSDVDGAINLGGPNQRFLSAYLSGGVYLGGTGSANYLDDYETGTWTPTFLSSGGCFSSVTSISGVSGNYTKIGNQVTAWYIFEIDQSITNAEGILRIDGLPFSSSFTNYGTGAAQLYVGHGGSDSELASAGVSTSTLYVYRGTVNGTTGTPNVQGFVTYQV